MWVVVIANQKGGEGKTTTTVNLAAELSSAEPGVVDLLGLGRPARVIVVDLDPQGSVETWDRQAELAGTALPFDVTSTSDVAQLRRVRDMPYDVVLVDTPGHLAGEATTKAAVELSDFVVVPTTAATALTLEPLVEAIERVIKPSGVPYRVLLNRMEPRFPSVAHNAAGVLERLGLDHFRTFVRGYMEHQFASNDGKVTTSYGSDPASVKAASDFARLALELAAALAPATASVKGA